MADVTPPVGLASYAAAGIARCDPIKTGVTAFGYSIRTAILPFMFIFNTQLLLIGIGSWWHLALVVASAILANLMFAAATQGWFLTRNKLWESAALLLVCFTLFRPGFWMDMLYPPFEELPPTEFARLVQDAPRNGNLRIWIEGLSLEGDEVSKGVLLPLGDTAPSATQRLNAIGVTTMALGDAVQIAAVKFGSRAEKLGLEQGFNITRIEIPSPERPAKEWMFIPALLLLALIWFIQQARARREDGTHAPTPAG